MVESIFNVFKILAHKNCKLFLTHGGFGSFVEAVVSQVPILGMPFFADQEKNINNAVKYGYGLQLDFDLITEEYIYESITKILNNTA
jgi:glucuronosyltransferase